MSRATGRRVVFVGATRGMGRALSRRLAERGDRLCLLGRDAEALRRAADDLGVRGACPPPAQIPCDLADPTMFDPALDAAQADLGRLDVVIVTAGLFATQEALEDDPALLARVLDVNVRGTVLLCEAAKRRMLAAGGGALVVFSSVAGARARSSNVLYGATKAALSAYLEGLDHRHHRDGLRVLDVKPGFVRTSMTAGLREPPFAGEPDQVARDVERALDRDAAVVFTPRAWGPVMSVVRRLPRAVMRRARF
ncbi:MAG: SDR family NAD(P)-dependent oxidoreductase [Polyangiaceae bacterium]|nr:SDR family NAD(P)-dependent oxidoreductase [Polyangiaceae bacterium]